MYGIFTRRAGQVGVNGHSGYPGQPVAREHQRPGVAIFARHSRVHKDVLELARTPAAQRSHPKAWTAEADREFMAGAKMCDPTIAAARATCDHESGLLSRVLRRNDLHVVPHNTETQAAGKIHAPTASPRTRHPEHRLDVLPGKAWLATSRLDIDLLQNFDRGGRVLGDLLPSRGGQGGRVNSPGDARPVSLEPGQDL
jgi:hypothetical protein